MEGVEFVREKKPAGDGLTDGGRQLLRHHHSLQYIVQRQRERSGARGQSCKEMEREAGRERHAEREKLGEVAEL